MRREKLISFLIGAALVTALVGCYIAAGVLVPRWAIETPEPVEVEAEPVDTEPVEPTATARAVQPMIAKAAQPVTADEPQTEEPTYTESEASILALIIYQEAGSDACSDETRIMIGNVFLNRVNDDRFPDTFEEVAKQQGQWGRLHWTGLVWPARSYKASEAEAVERAEDCAERVLNGETLCDSDVVWAAEFPQGTGTFAQQDGFYFCY